MLLVHGIRSNPEREDETIFMYTEKRRSPIQRDCGEEAFLYYKRLGSLRRNGTLCYLSSVIQSFSGLFLRF